MLLPLAVVAVLLFGFWAVYLFKGSTKTNSYQTELKQMQTVSTSDDTSDIEKDLNNTNLDNLDSELNSIDSLLQ